MSKADSQLPKSDWIRHAIRHSNAVRNGAHPDNAMTIKTPKRRKSKASSDNCAGAWYFCDESDDGDECIKSA